MFNNTASYPLLLIGALQQTGILSMLIVTDESVKDAIERANSYFLVFSTVSNCLTFAVGPRYVTRLVGGNAGTPDQSRLHGTSNLFPTRDLTQNEPLSDKSIALSTLNMLRKMTQTQNQSPTLTLP